MTTSRPVIEASRAAKLRVGVLCVGMDPSSRAALEVMIARTPGAHVVDDVERRIAPREVMRMLEDFQYRICVIDFDDSMEECCRFASHLRDNCDKTINLVAACGDSNPETIIATMRAGCSEFLVKPFDPDRVSEALSQVTSRRHIREEGAVPGRAVTLVGAKGGAGVTSLALQLALSLVTRHNKKCLLVDQHPALGDASLYLGLPRRHTYSFYELVNNTDRLDEELLQGYLLKDESGLHVLDSPEVIDRYPNPAPEAIEHTLAFLVDQYDYVLIDCPPGMNEQTTAAIRQSDRLAIVITPELPAIRNAVRTIQYLVGLHYPEDHIDVVLNRASRTSALSVEEMEQALKRPIAVSVPNSYDDVVKAINAGTPVQLAHSAKLGPYFERWADRLIGAEPSQPSSDRGKRGWFGLFGSLSEV
jgi:pilus assembly protein CpaE